MKFEELLRKTWDKYLQAIVKLVIFTLIGSLLCIVIIPIPAVVRGFTRGFLDYAREGKEPEYDLLWNFGGYLNMLILLILLAIIISIGYMLLIIPGIITSVFLLYTVYYLVDKDMGALDSMKASVDLVKRTGFVNNFIILLIIAVINGIGMAAAGLGSLLTTPFTLLLLAYAYNDLSKEENMTVNSQA